MNSGTRCGFPYIALLTTLLCLISPTAFGQCVTDSFVPLDANYGNAGWNYDRDQVAVNFGLLAAASADAYQPSEQRRDFAIADNDARRALSPARFGRTGWLLLGRFGTEKRGNEPLIATTTGLSADFYLRPLPDRILFLAAFRGTDGLIDSDTFSNLSYLFRAFNPNDQYDLSRKVYAAYITSIKNRYPDRPIEFVVTGHSLGGGLAQHIAYHFPCVTAVVFNSSFVTNSMFTATQTPKIIRVYERDDIFSRVELATRTRTNDAIEAEYRVNTGENKRERSALGFVVKEHNIENMAASLLRLALDCDRRGACRAQQGAVDAARTIYCHRYKGLRGLTDKEVCTPLRGNLPTAARP